MFASSYYLEPHLYYSEEGGKINNLNKYIRKWAIVYDNEKIAHRSCNKK